MELSFLIKVFGIGMIVSFAYQILEKSGRDELALLVSVSGIIIIFALIVSRISELINVIESVFGI